MIDLYTWPTPNGYKVSIMLEEVSLPDNVIAVNIGEGDQFESDYLKINPNNKMPSNAICRCWRIAAATRAR